MNTLRIFVRLLLATAVWITSATAVHADQAAFPADPLFDWPAILNDPLDAKILKSEEADGIVREEFEYTSQVKDGQPERVFGILCYPKGGTNLPAMFWSQSGMYDANDYFPKIFAKKGYFCLNVTLPHNLRNSFAVFDTQNPRQANLTRLAVDQLRAITYMTTRSEVDKDRIGVGGSSYGGFYATFLAGVDPRLKAGFSFFGAGRHELGTNLPQFDQMPSREALAVWNKTIDPAWRLTKRPVPFLWCAAANDNWFHLPAVVATYEGSIGDKRLAILPHWQHGFPPNVDQQLVDWLDTCLTKTRKPYNQAGALTIKKAGRRLRASWSWTGENAVTNAALVVAYGPSSPWHGWVQRHHQIFPATIAGQTAAAEIPVPQQGLELYVYGNITDDQGVVISTVPVPANPKALGVGRTAPKLVLNCFPIGEFEPADVHFFQAHGWPCAPADTAEKHGGAQSLRLEPGKPFTMQLWHIPRQGHTLRLWLKAGAPTAVEIAVNGIPPQNWKYPLVDQLRRAASATAQPVAETPAKFTQQTKAEPNWREFALDCPFDGNAVEGYTLTVTVPKDAPGPAWLDSVRFQPVWGK
ncbi:dienelactone hydrolase family protein [bacterium]|nr:dienelactone hydrolase family protein [bacterium]